MILNWQNLLFFLNRTNISGVIKGGIIGGYKQLGKYKIDARFNKSDLIDRIHKIASFKHRIVVSNLDGLAFINIMNKKKGRCFHLFRPSILFERCRFIHELLL